MPEITLSVFGMENLCQIQQTDVWRFFKVFFFFFLFFSFFFFFFPIGHTHSFENNLLRCSWSADGSKIAAGSSDRNVYVWNTTSRKILYKLPGSMLYMFFYTCCCCCCCWSFLLLLIFCVSFLFRSQRDC